jgi:hypothetical protein
MLKSPISPPSLAFPKFALVELASASPPSPWQSLSDIVSGIVRDVELKSADKAGDCDLPKAA